MHPTIIEAWLEDLQAARSLPSQLPLKRGAADKEDTAQQQRTKIQRRETHPTASSSSASKTNKRCLCDSICKGRPLARSIPRAMEPQRRIGLRPRGGNPEEASSSSSAQSKPQKPRTTKPQALSSKIADKQTEKHDNNGGEGSVVPSVPPTDRRFNSSGSVTSSSAYRGALQDIASLDLSVPTRLTSRSSQSKGSSLIRRPTSPVKKAANLRDVGNGVLYANLGGNRANLGDIGYKLYRDVHCPALQMGIVPSQICDEIEALEPEPIETFQQTPNDDRDLSAIQQEFRKVREIVQLSSRCERDLEGEAEWNNAVHSTVLRFVLDADDEEVGMRYV